MSILSSILDPGGSTTALTSASTSTDASSTSTTPTTTTVPTTSATTTSTSSSPSLTSTSTSSSTSPTSTSSTTTSSSSSSLTTSAPTPTTSAPSVTTTSSSSLIPTTSVLTSTNGGGTETVTVVNSVTPTESASPSSTSAASGSGSSSSFLQNKGAVAGTFTVVGIVGAVIIIWAITYLVRRRRANKYDRESEEAAAEAANATAPVFLDDDDDRPTYGNRYLDAGGGYGGYEGGGNYTGPVPSASSHGTYAQPAMAVGSNENYPMAEFGSSQYPGNSPYPAFMTPGAAPQHNNYFDYGYAGTEGHSSPPMNATRPLSGAHSIPEIPEHSDGGDGAGAVGMSMAYGGMHPSLSRGYSTVPASQSQTDLSRNKSQGSRSLVDGYNTNHPPSMSGHDFVAPTNHESYAAHYQPGFSGMRSSAAPSRRSTIAYDEAPALPNPFTRNIEPEDGTDDESDEGEHPQKKVLKVANE